MTRVEPVERPQRVFMTLLIVGSLALLVMPFVTTFDDFLTTLVRGSGFDTALQRIVPEEARMVVVVLSLLHVHAAAFNSEILVWNGAALPVALFISWNCIGWQSAVLFLLSLLTGLRGSASWSARAQVFLLGALGTFFVNLARVTIVCLLAATFGRIPAVLFHDYGGTVLVIGWLFCFWALSYRWLLLAPDSRTA